MNISDTASIAEFAIVVAGFAGLVVTVAQRGGRVHPLDRYRTATMLLYALTAAFGALLPTLIASLSPDPDVVWVASSLTLGTLILVSLLFTLGLQRMLSDEQRVGLKKWMWALVVGGNSVLVLWIFGNGFGVIGGSPAAPFFFGLVWQLVLAAILFVRLILVERTPAE